MLVTYEDKVQHTANPLADEFKWTASDANHIKAVINQNYQDFLTSLHYKGAYANAGALTAAHPTATAGDYALVDAGGSQAELYIWDATDAEWVASGVTTIVPNWSDSVAGKVERSTQAESEAIITQVIAEAVGTLSGDRTPSEVGLYYLLSKLKALRVLKRTAVSVNTGTMTLPFAATDEERRFEATAAISSNFALAFGGTLTNIEVFTLILPITGTVVVTVPSSVISERNDARWSNGAKTLTLTATGTGDIFEISFTRKDGPKYQMRAGYAQAAT